MSSHKQDAFRAAFNAALKTYGGDESQAYAVAYGAAHQAPSKKRKMEKAMDEPVLVLPIEDGVEVVEDLAKAGPTQGGDKPYGDVEYADPGYKDDGKKRYPLTKNRLQSAWRYINMPENHEGYSSENVAAIKSKISSAYEKAFGHKPGEGDDDD